MPYNPGVQNQGGMLIAQGIMSAADAIAAGMKERKDRARKLGEDTARFKRLLVDAGGFEPGEVESMSLGEMEGAWEGLKQKNAQEMLGLQRKNLEEMMAIRRDRHPLELQGMVLGQAAQGQAMSQAGERHPLELQGMKLGQAAQGQAMSQAGERHPLEMQGMLMNQAAQGQQMSQAAKLFPEIMAGKAAARKVNEANARHIDNRAKLAAGEAAAFGEAAHPFNRGMVAPEHLTLGDRYVAAGGRDPEVFSLLQKDGEQGFSKEELGQAKPVPGQPGLVFVPTGKTGGTVVHIGEAGDLPKVGDEFESKSGIKYVFTGRTVDKRPVYVQERADDEISMKDLLYASFMEKGNLDEAVKNLRRVKDAGRGKSDPPGINWDDI